jgi:hypothetical protein
MKIETVATLSDPALDAEVRRLAACERDITVALVLHLSELETRRLHLGQGFPSLYSYCRVALSLSEHAAYHRIVAARAVRRHPAIAEMLADGTLNLSTLRLLAPHLTRENAQELLAAARGRSKRVVEEMVAARFPQPARPTSMRKAPVRARAMGATDAGPASPTPADSSSTDTGATGTCTQGMTAGAMSPSTNTTGTNATATETDPGASTAKPEKPIAPPLPSRPARVVPCAEDVFDFRFSGTRRLRDTIDAARDLLRHAVPDGDLGAIVERAMTLLLDDLRRTKLGATDRPRPGRVTAPGSRTIPAAVERVVWARDEGRCAFVAESGRRCDATALLEFHHADPFAVGGPPTVENVQLRCRAHNQYEARVFYERDEEYDRWYRKFDPAM